MTTGELIQNARKAAGLSQRSLAETIGVSRPTLGHYEHGRQSPTIATLRRIAEALSVSPHSLVEPLTAAAAA